MNSLEAIRRSASAYDREAAEATTEQDRRYAESQAQACWNDYDNALAEGRCNHRPSSECTDPTYRVIACAQCHQIVCAGCGAIADEAYERQRGVKQ